MSDFRSDLQNTSFDKSPADTVVNHEQYINDLGNVLDRHAPLVYRLIKKDSAEWMSDDYRRVKSQFERTWLRPKIDVQRQQFERTWLRPKIH